MLGEFEVYIRSVGFKSLRDSMDRFFIFKRSQRGRYPEKNEIIDNLICLAIIYGGTKQMGIDQKVQKQLNPNLPRPSKSAHGYPCDMPDTVVKQPSMERTMV